MITWMQRHRKWLVITIWISTIAFIGAGVVGWGQYNYGKNSGSIAKVGDIEISAKDFNQQYGRLYDYFNRMFQGKFDEAQAKSFGLKQQTLNQLINQALLLNLAKSYNLEASDEEVYDVIKSQPAFQDKGAFNEDVYRSVLSRNNLSTVEYEESLRKQLIIGKTFKLLAIKPTKNEEEAINSVLDIADKINYKVLDESMIHVQPTDEKLKEFYKGKENNFMTEPSFDISYITETPVKKEYSDDELKAFYKEHRTELADVRYSDSLSKETKERLTAAYNDKATEKEAKRTYVAYKNGELAKDIKVKNAVISTSKNIFTPEVLKELSELPMDKPFLKPKVVNNEYVIIKLNKVNPSVPKSYLEAKSQLVALYLSQAKEQELKKLAENSVATFNGKNTDFITSRDGDKIAGLTKVEGAEFLNKLFNNNKKRGFVTLSNKKIVLFHILEQKLLNNSKENVDSVIVKIKTDLLNENLLQMLKKRYPIEIYKGL